MIGDRFNMMKADARVLDDPLKSSQLGMESRSILKSIQTEESKLIQSNHFTRSDRHYFRARFNYYRLSLLRLPADERAVLEPVLGAFLAKITSLENDQEARTERGSEPDETRSSGGVSTPPPFLAAVHRSDHRHDLVDSLERIEAATKNLPTQVRDEAIRDVISQLSLLKLALSGELGEGARKILAEGIDRSIKLLRSS